MLQRTIRILIFVFCVMTAMIVSAQQIQHGYVKTRGKLIDGKVIAGKRVPNVAITIDGVNTIISSNTGEFSFPVRKEFFSIRSVLKAGYSLVDNNILNQEFSYSSSPLIIVVEDNTELTQEKIRITRQIRLSLQRKLEEKENSLEELRNHNKITIGEYNSLLNELYEEQVRNEGVIGNIVDYSMGTDYDSFDEINAQIQEYIYAGNLSKADSIIHNWDLSERLLQLNNMRLELQENVSRKESVLNEQLMVKKTLAKELKIRSQLYIQENKLDSALICLSNRIELDSTFYEHYLDKAILLRDKFPEKNHESEILFAKSISHAIENPDKFISAIEYGAYCQQIGEFDKAILQYSNALNYIETEDSISKVNVLTKLGIAYNSMRNYEEALSYYQQALLYVTPTQINYQQRSAELYNNIGVLYENQNKNGRALDANYKALHIRQGLYVDDPDNPDIAMSYSNIASAYDNIEAWEQAIKYYKKAIEIYESNKGNPELAYVYNNISSCYYNADSLALALHFANLSLIEIRKYFSDSHAINISIKKNLEIIDKETQNIRNKTSLFDIACEQQELGDLYAVFRDFEYSQYYYNNALENFDKLSCPEYVVENHVQLARLYSNKNIESNSYLFLSIFKNNSVLDYNDSEKEINRYKSSSTERNLDYKNAISHYESALRIINEHNLPRRHYIYNGYNIESISKELGALYANVGDYTKCNENYIFALKGYEALFKKDSLYQSDLADMQLLVGNLFRALQKYQECEKYYKLALENYEHMFLKNPDYYRYRLTLSQYLLGMTNISMNDYTSAEHYFCLSLNNYEQLHLKEPNQYSAGLLDCQMHLGDALFYQNNYSECEKYYKLALENTKKFSCYFSPYESSEYLADVCYRMMRLYADLEDINNYDKYLDLTLELLTHLYKYEPNAYLNNVIELQNRKVWRLLANMEVDDALMLAEATYSMDCSNEESKEYLAICYNSKAYEYAKASDFENAHESIGMAISLAPNNSDYYDSKGEILLMQGKKEDALAMWKKVLELNPNFLKDYPDGTNLSNGLKKFGLIE